MAPGGIPDRRRFADRSFDASLGFPGEGPAGELVEVGGGSDGSAAAAAGASGSNPRPGVPLNRPRCARSSVDVETDDLGGVSVQQDDDGTPGFVKRTADVLDSIAASYGDILHQDITQRAAVKTGARKGKVKGCDCLAICTANVTSWGAIPTVLDLSLIHI